MIKKLLDKYKNMPLPVKSGIWFTLANFLNLGISVITTPFITRLLTTFEYGEINLYLTWSAILSIIITFNLSAGVYEVMLLDYEEDRDNLTLSLIILTIILSLIGLIVFVMFKKYITKITGLSIQFLILMLIEMLFFKIVSFWITKNRFVYNFKSSVIVSIVLTVVRTTLTLLLIIFIDSNNVLMYILGLTLPYVIIGGGVLVHLLKQTKININTNYWLFALKFNLVLIPHYLSNVLLSSSDKIVISKMVGNDKAGIYSLSYSVASIILVLFNSINLVYTPFVYNMLKEGKYRKIKKTSNILIILSSTFAIGLIIVAPEMIKIFAPVEYQEGIYLIPPITLGVFMTFMYNLFSNIEFYYKKNNVIMFATILSFLLNIILNILLIPIFGYQAAAYTTLVSYLLMAFIHYRIYVRIIPEPIYDIRFIFLVILGTIILGLSLMLIYPYLLARIIMVFLLGLAAILKRKDIISLFKEIGDEKHKVTDDNV